jgi:hypothetical protein
MIATISAGLLYTLDIGTPAGKWIGYQILAGFGYGIALQVPVIVGQATSAPSDIAPTTAIILCECSPILAYILVIALYPLYVSIGS